MKWKKYHLERLEKLREDLDWMNNDRMYREKSEYGRYNVIIRHVQDIVESINWFIEDCPFRVTYSVNQRHKEISLAFMKYEIGNLRNTDLFVHFYYGATSLKYTTEDLERNLKTAVIKFQKILDIIIEETKEVYNG